MTRNERAESNVNNMLKDYGRHLFIGNMVYASVNDRPCYCYERDYNGSNDKFMPIWDKESTYEFGWADFASCQRIFEMIIDKLGGNTTKAKKNAKKQFEVTIHAMYSYTINVTAKDEEEARQNAMKKAENSSDDEWEFVDYLDKGENAIFELDEEGNYK